MIDIYQPATKDSSSETPAIILGFMKYGCFEANQTEDSQLLDHYVSLTLNTTWVPAISEVQKESGKMQSILCSNLF